jgi:hypothetical protein
MRYTEPSNEQRWKELAVAAGKAERRVALLRVGQPLGAVASAPVTATGGKDEPKYTPLVKLNPEQSTGRRLALAKWIADRNNPLTARVAVNHVWMRHFGRPLVGTVANFGLNGQKPTHPELLDWLAVEFAESGWSMKHLHRLLVTSRAYRMTSSAEFGMRSAESKAKSSIPQSALPTPHSADAENRWYWRMNPRRLEAEAVRDAVLAVAGRLDPAMGGPILDEKLGQTSRRRSVYFRFNNEYKMTFLDQFDPASPTECYERRESVIPQQALALSNSALALNLSRLLAKELSTSAPDAGAFVAAAFERVLGRPPTAEERERCVRFLKEQAGRFVPGAKLTPFPAGPDAVTPAAADPGQRAREDLVGVLFNHNDFVTVR